MSAETLPDELSAGGAWPLAVLAAGMFLAPAMGATSEEMLQDTLKSTVISFTVLVAAITLFWEGGRRHFESLALHAVLGLPLMLMAYALGSMAWSHTYLAGVEAIRWFVFALLLWIGLNTLTRERLPWLACGIHLGAVAASSWAVAQFWFDFGLFPQGPPPASTFINRNFFAEFAVCTLPFGAVLLARARLTKLVALLSFTSGVVIVAILMTGTRAALVALWLQLLVLFPLAVWKFKKPFAMAAWSRATRLVAIATLLATVAGLGLMPTGNAEIVREGRGTNALERAIQRTGSISASDPSLGVRLTMWRATLAMIAAHPVAGVGAGAWENEVPLFQAEGSQLETDFYVHNEYLQLVAEYGVVGWLFLLGLLSFMLDAIRQTLRASIDPGEALWRCVFLCSLTAFGIVSSIGFPWRMAVTGALFALCLGGLAASDSRLAIAGRWRAIRFAWSAQASQVALAGSVMALALAIHIAWQAALCESDLVRASKLALRIAGSANPNDPAWDAQKRELLELTSNAIAINPHYRKITPIIADEVARWGDWRDATWIWESVLQSRPHVVAIIANVARGHAVMGDYAMARVWLDKARRVQPNATSIRSLEVIILARTGEEARALQLVRQALATGDYDFDLVNTGFSLATRSGDYDLAARAMLLRVGGWPASAAPGYVQLGIMYVGLNETTKAIAAFRQAKDSARPSDWPALAQRVPPGYRSQLAVPAAVPPQTSASKG